MIAVVHLHAGDIASKVLLTKLNGHNENLNIS